MERIITIFSNENDLIIDTFSGSGSTLVAAKKLKRNFIGSEINSEYVDITNKRLEEIELEKI
jgi:DNA modification methylase